MFSIRRVIGTAVAMVALSGAAVAQDITPETRVGEEGFESPPASLSQMDWLVGQWSGEGIGGAPAMESWLPPSGGTMVGTFVQTTSDSDGAEAIMFTEHLYLMEEDETLVLRLKHFNADLTGWEEKDGMLTFRLLALEPCAAYFHALTLRCADAERPGEGLVAAVRMKSDKAVPQELIFRFDQMRDFSSALVCADATTTLDMNECYGQLLARTEARMAQYLDAALERVSQDDSQTLLMRSTQEGFLAYRGGECGAVHERYKGGSIRTVMYLSCAIALTDERTHRIWQNWLTYADSTPPVLPEPEPTR